jgi:hypothetical protein
MLNCYVRCNRRHATSARCALRFNRFMAKCQFRLGQSQGKARSLYKSRTSCVTTKWHTESEDVPVRKATTRQKHMRTTGTAPVILNLVTRSVWDLRLKPLPGWGPSRSGYCGVEKMFSPFREFNCESSIFQSHKSISILTELFRK